MHSAIIELWHLAIRMCDIQHCPRCRNSLRVLPVQWGAASLWVDSQISILSPFFEDFFQMYLSDTKFHICWIIYDSLLWKNASPSLFFVWLWSSPPFPILMSTREIWLLAIFVWREAKIYLKLLLWDNILLSDSKMTSNLKIRKFFSNLEQFL